MKRKSLVAVAVLSASMMLAACGNAGQNNAGSNATQAVAQSNSKYYFTAKNTDLKIDGNLTEYTTALGEPSGGYYEAKSCAFDGMDKFYTYDSFVLQGYQKDGQDRLYAITLSDDSVKTKEGVRIGDKKDKVVSAYGNEYKEENGQLIYTSENTSLVFVIKGDTVESIQYTMSN